MINELTPKGLELINYPLPTGAFTLGRCRRMNFNRIDLIPHTDGTIMNFSFNGVLLMTKLCKGEYALDPGREFHITQIEGSMGLELEYEKS